MAVKKNKERKESMKGEEYWKERRMHAEDMFVCFQQPRRLSNQCACVCFEKRTENNMNFSL